LPKAQANKPFRLGKLEWAVFTGLKEQKFIANLTDYLAERNTAFAKTPPERQKALIQSLIEQSASYGIRIEQAIANFSLASLIFARRLATDPIMERFLTSDMHPLDKSKRVLAEAQSRVSQNG
jgi:hypothetical protein